MIFRETTLPGAFLIDIEPIQDDRGLFARAFCKRQSAQHGLETDWAQCNISQNGRRGTVRGLHFQRAPHEEAKLVRCTRGAIFDVMLDLRPDSRTFRQWLGNELRAESHRMVYVPKGFAHGFQTLADDTEVYYHVSTFFEESHYTGVRWDDPAFGIFLPLPVTEISTQDSTYPDFSLSKP